MAIVKFAEQHPELTKAFAAYAEARLSAERNIGGKVAFSTPKSEMENAIQKLFMEEVEKKAGVSIEDCGGAEYFAQIPQVRAFADQTIAHMINAILPQTINSSIGLISEVSHVGYSENAKFKLGNNGLYVIAEAAPDQKFTVSQRMHDTEVTVNPVNHMITTNIKLYDIVVGRTHIADVAFRMTRSIEQKMAADVWACFVSAVNTTDLPAALKATGYSDAGIVKIAQTVQAYNNAPVTIVGTQLATSKLGTDINGMQYTLDDAAIRDGKIGTYRGFSVMTQPQFADPDNLSTFGLKLNDKQLFLISGASDSIVKVVLGQAIPAGTLAGTDGQFISMNVDYAASVATNAIAGLIDWSE